MTKKSAARERTVILKKVLATASCGHEVYRENIPWVLNHYTAKYDVCTDCYRKRRSSQPIDEEWVSTVRRTIEEVEVASGRPFGVFDPVVKGDLNEVKAIKPEKIRRRRKTKAPRPSEREAFRVSTFG